MLVKQIDPLCVRLERARLLPKFFVSFVQRATPVAAEFEFQAIQPNRLAGSAVRTIGLVDEFASSTMSFSEPLIRLVQCDFSQRHAQRHPSRLAFEVRARFGFIDDHDVRGFSWLHRQLRFRGGSNCPPHIPHLRLEISNT